MTPLMPSLATGTNMYCPSQGTRGAASATLSCECEPGEAEDYGGNNAKDSPLLAIMVLQTWTMMGLMDHTLNNLHHHHHTHLRHLSLFHHQYHPPCLSFLHLPQMRWVMYPLLVWLILKHLHLARLLLLTQPLLRRCQLHPNSNSLHSMPHSLILQAARNNILQWVLLR